MSLVMMPLIIMAAGFICGIGLKKAFRAGLFVGIGFAGMLLVLNLFFQEIAPAMELMVERWGIELDVLDVGWGVSAALAWGYGYIVPIVVAAIVVLNLLMLGTKQTKTLMVDFWNYWHFLLAANAVFFLTGSIVLAVIAAMLVAGIIFKIADWTAPIIQKEFDLPGVSIPHGAIIPWFLPAYCIVKILDKTPLNRIQIRSETFKKKLGFFGEPAVLGFFLGLIIGALGGKTANGIIVTGLTASGFMLLMPRMVGIIAEGLVPVSEGAREFFSKKFSGREIFFGLDGIILFGKPAMGVVMLLLIPVVILISLVLPGNRVLPFADLIGFPVVIWSVILSKGNIIKGLIASSILMVFVFLISTSITPILTGMGVEAGFPVSEGSWEISSLIVGGQWINWIVVYLAELLGDFIII